MSASTVKKLSLAIALTLLLSPGVQAQNKTYEVSDAVNVNNFDHLSALVRTDRDPRSWKTLWIIPGKEKYFYYEIIRADGSTVTKIETIRLKHIPDKREIADAHPNVAISIIVGETFGSFLGGIVSSYVHPGGSH